MFIHGLGCHVFFYFFEAPSGAGTAVTSPVHLLLLAARPQVSASGGFVTRLGDASQSRRRPALGHQGHDQGAEGAGGSGHMNATQITACRSCHALVLCHVSGHTQRRFANLGMHTERTQNPLHGNNAVQVAPVDACVAFTCTLSGRTIT